MSFHGIPERNVRLGDPYADQCRNTARLLAQALQLQPEQHTVNGQIAAALMANAATLLSSPPNIEKVELLAAKLPA